MLVSVFIFDKDFVFNGISNIEVVMKVGELVVKCVVEKGVKEVVFDCGGYLYYGCVKVLVEVVCEVGL